MGAGRWTFLREPELRLGDDIVVPDVAGWHRERLAALSLDASEIDIPPDWVGEVLLLSTEALVRKDKMDIYHRGGVLYVWLIHPAYHLLEAYRRHEPIGWARLGVQHGDDTSCFAPFESFDLELTRLWHL